MKRGNRAGSILSTLGLVLIFFTLAGCATVPDENGTQSARVDPLEGMNRSVSRFNDKVDDYVFKPVARTYSDYVPGFIQTGIGNFFGNINDAWTAINSLLQGNGEEGFSDLARFGLNSTFGFLGIFDIASEAKIPKHKTDFGQTLGVWGVPNGPYLVIPFLGPSVIRDAAVLPVDYYADLWSYYRPVYVRNMGTGVRMIDRRASYLDSYSLLEDAALDKYIFIRDAYLQRIDSQIESRKNSKKNRDEESEWQTVDDENAAKELNALEVSK